MPGAHGTFLEKVVSGLLFGDATPAAPTVMGEVGWVFVGWFPEVSATVEGDAIYVAQWVQQMFEVRFIDYDGRLVDTQMVVYGGSATAPISPSRSGYTFTGWSPAFNYITSNLTVTAQYTQNSNGNNSGSSNKPSTPSTPPKTTPTLPPPTETPPEGGENEEILAMWALVNLLISVTGIILAIILLIYILLQKKQKQKQQQKNTKHQTEQKYNSDEQKTMDDKQRKQHRNIWMFAALALGIVGIIVFLLTEDMNLPMGLVDKWTIVNVVIFVVEIISLMLVFKHKKSNKNQEEHNSSYSPSQTSTTP